MTLGEKIKYLRLNSKMTQEELADAAETTKQTIHKYETGIIENIPASKVKAIADKLGTTPAYLMGWENNYSKPTNKSSGIKIPVLGTVRAGIPIEAIEEILDYEEISREMASQGDYFALQIKGDSMEPKFSDGDVVIIRKQPDVDNGDIAIVLVNGDEATVKKIRKQTDGISLIPTNAKYDIMFYTNSEIESKPVNIIGKVVELRAKF